MLRLQASVTDIVPTSRRMARRTFLRTTGFLVLSTGAVAMIGCDGGADILDPNLDDPGDTNPDPVDNGDTIDPGDVDGDPVDNNEPPVDDPPDGVEIPMSADLLNVGGVQVVGDKATLTALDSDNANGGDDPVILVRVDEATVAANTVTCTHQQCNVAYDNGRGLLVCPCHGSEYRLDGSVKQGPAPRPLLSFDATIHEDSVFLVKA